MFGRYEILCCFVGGPVNRGSWNGDQRDISTLRFHGCPVQEAQEIQVLSIILLRTHEHKTHHRQTTSTDS